ncbi:THO complex subunit 6 homolog [Fopius arisanus]|uniref:THO complex subunit 6 homolog n=1 Tax=Fopius arisanus TaxID=64838 RepID=A0A9R1T0C4_9HYME|nr:PREDICTED: THO complex subunit 6 homolog [Fopius arisanus]
MTEDIDKQKLFYNTVLSQTFSPSGKFLICSNIYGDISVFDIPRILGPSKENDNDLPGPLHKFSAHVDQHIESMLTTENFLVTGTAGEISGWDWKVLTSDKAPKSKVSWTIQMPVDRDTSEKPDVNDLVYSTTDHVVYAGLGDNRIYAVDLEHGKVLRKFEGHTDYIHNLALLNNQLASTSEDGSVKLWDVRKNENTNVIQPHLVDKVARPRLGKWVGAVDFTEDWLVCGGGPHLSLWHLRTMEPATIFELPDQGIHVASIYEERIITGGAMPHVYHLSYQAETLAKVPTSSNTVYSIIYHETPHKILSIAGSSNNIDVCTNFNYRELILKFA